MKNNSVGLKDRFLGSLSTFGFVGKKLPAPGTWGSVLGVIFYYFVFQVTGINTPETWIQYFVFAALLLAIAIPICEAGEKILGKTDPGEVIFDEFACMPICYIGMGKMIEGQSLIYWLLAGFVLFRMFDIFKPWKIKDLQKLKGGWGVVADDFAAALASAAVLWAIFLISKNF